MKYSKWLLISLFVLAVPSICSAQTTWTGQFTHDNTNTSEYRFSINGVTPSVIVTTVLSPAVDGRNRQFTFPAPTTSGTYTFAIFACSAFCSTSSNVVSISPPGAPTGFRVVVSATVTIP